MRAAIYEQHGPARDVIRVIELPDPEPEPGDVRVRMAVSGVNPSDVKRRAGSHGGPPRWAYQILHQDGAGEIDAVGEGVDHARIGQRVWVHQAAVDRPDGTAATFACVPSHLAVPLPDHVSFEQGAGLGVPFVTAHEAVFCRRNLTGRSVLVTGGAGAVGHAAIQFATWAGAEVVATVSSQAKADLARQAGAVATLDYRPGDLPGRLDAVRPDGIDHVIDVAIAANLNDYIGRLRPDASVVAYATDTTTGFELPVRPLLALNATLRFVLVYNLSPDTLTEACSTITDGLRRGLLQGLPVHRYPLNDVPAAHEAVEAGAVGKVLIDLD